jgi:glyoxylase-like metal-dependent hydrolase (beta-lactamase superfamily II)
MFFRPFYDYNTGCAAYVLGCGTKGLCAVVDPLERAIEDYAAFAQQKGMRITHVIETHVHADHRSGGRALAERAAARYCLHRSAALGFPFEPLDDGQRIELGNTILQVLHTPGHTPESISLVVSDLRRGTDPWFVLTGDTLFVGAVGRPDLPGHERENAAELYGSLRKLAALPDDLEIYPAHFAGSACGAGHGISGKPASTIAFEKRWNPLLALARDEFVSTVSTAIPPKPTDMQDILRFNQGR